MIFHYYFYSNKKGKFGCRKGIDPKYNNFSITNFSIFYTEKNSFKFISLNNKWWLTENSGLYINYKNENDEHEINEKIINIYLYKNYFAFQINDKEVLVAQVLPSIPNNENEKINSNLKERINEDSIDNIYIEELRQMAGVN